MDDHAGEDRSVQLRYDIDLAAHLELQVAAYLSRWPINYWVFEASATVVGIVNMLIYVRVGLG